MKKNNLLHICFLIIILFSNCTYKRSIQKEVDLNRAIESATNMLNKLNYNYSFLQTSNSNSERKIEYLKTFKGRGKIYINSVDNINTKIDIISTASEKEARIIERALTQEMNKDFTFKKEDVGKKSYLLFYGLALITPGLGFFYEAHNNPYADSTAKWTSLLLNTGLDALYIYGYFQSSKNQDYFLTLLIADRVLVMFLGTFQIRNYNDIVDSGYDVYDIHYTYNPIKKNNHNYKLALFSKKI